MPPPALPLPVRLSAFYFAFFAWWAAYVAYLPLYLSGRGLGAGEIALVLALPQAARIVTPTAWGWLADRFGAQRGIVALSCVMMILGFVALPFVHGAGGIALVIGAMGIFSTAALPLVEAITMTSLGGRAGLYGPIRLWGSIGFILVVLAGGAWLDVGSVGVLPGSLVAIALVALAAALFLPAGAEAFKRDIPHAVVRLEADPAAREN